MTRTDPDTNSENDFYHALRHEIRRLMSHAGQADIQKKSGQELKASELEKLAKSLRLHVDGFTNKRSVQVQSRLQKNQDLAAYMAYYSVRSFALARQFHKHFKLDPARLVDIGSGPASAALACALNHGQARIDLVEPSDLALRSAGHLAAQLRLPGPKKIASRIETSTLAAKKYSSILAFFSLNEWPDDPQRRMQWVQQAYQGLAPGGQLLIVEPALRKTARDLSALRDGLIEAGLQLVAPCRHMAPCPMLQRRRDYCHGSMLLDVPQDFVRLGEMVGHMNLRDTDYAYLLFRAPDATISAADDDRTNFQLYRVIAHARHEKGRLRRFVCGEQGLLELSALTRASAQGAEALEDLRRGDEICLNKSPKNGRLRLTDAGDVRKLGWRP